MLTSLGFSCDGFDYGIAAEAKEFDGINQYIRITDIDDDSSSYTSRNSVSPSFLDENCVCIENDILFARTGASTGKTYLYNRNDGKLYFAGFLIRANVKPIFDPYFVFTMTKTSRYANWIKIMSARSGQPGINAQEYKTFSFYHPSLKTQNKISKFIKNIDKRIQTQSKIIKEYKTLKNAIINHLFFCNSNLDEKIKLSKFATLRNGYAFKSSDYTDNGNYNILTIANVKGDRYIYASECNKIGEIPKDIQNHQILKINDILISLTGNVGRVSLVNIDNCLLNQRVGVLSILDENYREYIFQVISSKHFENKMILKGQGAAQKNIGNDDIESFDIPFSKNHLYMNKLVNLLVSFDKKIATEEQILNDYQSQKKYLLNNMFI